MPTKLRRYYWILQCKHGNVATDADELPKLFSTKAEATAILRANKELFADCTYQPVRLYVSDQEQ